MRSILYVWWIFHPLHGDGYQFYSGIATLLPEIALLFFAWGWLTSRNCHVAGCWRAAWHPDPVHGHPVCKRHHPHTGKVMMGDDGKSVLIEEERKPI